MSIQLFEVTIGKVILQGHHIHRGALAVGEIERSLFGIVKIEGVVPRALEMDYTCQHKARASVK